MTQLLRPLLCFLLLALTLDDTAARELRLCKGNVDNPPVYFLNREGPGDYLVRLALARYGHTAHVTPLPWQRCLAAVREGQFDGTLGAGANPAFFEFMRFPLKDRKPDPSRSLGHWNFVVVRKVGTSVDWDGVAFRNLSQPVLADSATVAIISKLKELQIPHMGHRDVATYKLSMLLLDRAQVSLVRETQAKILLESPEFQGRLEILPTPFLQLDGYLSIRKDLYDRQPEHFDLLWTEIGRLRASPQWSKTKRSLLTEPQTR